jgi:intein-encoded DNA endonuclease-like protein
MRTYEEYERILTLWERGYTKLAISQITDIPRTTIRECIEKFETLANLQEIYRNKLSWRSWLEDADYRKNYAYVLGLYLGDGDISKVNYTYRIRIVQDSKYPNILRSIEESLQQLLPNNKVQCKKHYLFNSHILSAYSQHIPEMFPQHGLGRKHTRKIELEDWQQTIVDEFPIEFLRGLYHSDGSRSVVRNKGSKRSYVWYQFAQKSLDIRKLYTDTLDKLGIAWTQQHRNTSVYRKVHTEFLDQVLGPKS